MSDTATTERAAIERAAIELADIRFAYNGAPFIDGLTARFRKGVITSIVGPNGCGKSTLVRLIDGLLTPHAGTVVIDGQSVTSMRRRIRAQRVAVLAQAGRTPAMTVEELVGCGRYPYQGVRGRLSREDREKVQQALEATGVAQFRHKDVRRLSGGERQRAFIAMTLAQDTDIIILDEPTTYLDIHACHEVMHLVHDLNESLSKTLIMVIHDLDLALRYSDDMVIMERGRIVFAGDVDDPAALGALEQTFLVRVVPMQEGDNRAFCLFPNPG
jgi:iron complex transport system ATP-binding protein